MRGLLSLCRKGLIDLFACINYLGKASAWSKVVLPQGTLGGKKGRTNHVALEICLCRTVSTAANGEVDGSC